MALCLKLESLILTIMAMLLMGCLLCEAVPMQRQSDTNTTNNQTGEDCGSGNNASAMGMAGHCMSLREAVFSNETIKRSSSPLQYHYFDFSQLVIANTYTRKNELLTANVNTSLYERCTNLINNLNVNDSDQNSNLCRQEYYCRHFRSENDMRFPFYIVDIRCIPSKSLPLDMVCENTGFQTFSMFTAEACSGEELHWGRTQDESVTAGCKVRLNRSSA